MVNYQGAMDVDDIAFTILRPQVMGSPSKLVGLGTYILYFKIDLMSEKMYYMNNMMIVDHHELDLKYPRSYHHANILH